METVSRFLTLCSALAYFFLCFTVLIVLYIFHHTFTHHSVLLICFLFFTLNDVSFNFRIDSRCKEHTWIGPCCGIVHDVTQLLCALFGSHFCLECFDTVGCQEEHPACKNWVMRCWCGYLSGVRCRLFVYGPANATAIRKPHHILPHLNPDWFYLSGTGLPRLPHKRGH